MIALFSFGKMAVMRNLIVALGILLVLCLGAFCIGQPHSLVSGEPLMSSPDKGYGWFVLPSINGFFLGTAHNK